MVIYRRFGDGDWEAGASASCETAVLSCGATRRISAKHVVVIVAPKAAEDPFQDRPLVFAVHEDIKEGIEQSVHVIHNPKENIDGIVFADACGLVGYHVLDDVPGQVGK